jgi:threonine dehydratase
MNSRTFDAGAVLGLDLSNFQNAAARLCDDMLRTPLLPYFGNGALGHVVLKAENLQPGGSFKIRCAANVASALAPVCNGRMATASVGNFALGLARASRSRGIRVSVHVPDTAARIKVQGLEHLGARVVEHPFDQWWAIMTSRQTGEDDGIFVHPVCEREVIEGNGTIGLELIEQSPEIDTVVVPFGGGGLASGIALAMRAAGSSARIVAVEVETSTPLASAWRDKRPVQVIKSPSFVDGIGSTRVLNDMWPLLQTLIDDVVTVSLADVRDAVRSAAAHNHLLLEGAGGAALAGALKYPSERVCAVLSGGNIDMSALAEILGPALP